MPDSFCKNSIGQLAGQSGGEKMDEAMTEATDKAECRKKIEQAVDAAKEEIEALDQQIFGEVIGVAQALDRLRIELDKVEDCLDERQFEKASSLGYNAVSHEFIFLQRTLGGLQQAEHDKQALISRVAMESGIGVFETVEPYVTAKIPSCQKKKADD